MKRLLTITLISLSFAAVRGQEEEDVVPSGYPASRYTSIWENSPFNREVIKAVEQSISSHFAQSLTLEGIVTDDNLGPIAYVRDMTTNQPIVITRVKSESHPYTIVSANLVKNPEETKVMITDGNESGEIGYVIAKLNQPIEQFQQPQQQPQNHPPPERRKRRAPLPPGGGFPSPANCSRSRNTRANRRQRPKLRRGR